MITRQDLERIKLRAVRTRLWYRILSKVERAIIDLTIKCTDKVRSNVLAATISTIISKILLSSKESFMTKAEKIGNEIAQKLGAIGERWGNASSCDWKRDKCFARFLGVTAINT